MQHYFHPNYYALLKDLATFGLTLAGIIIAGKGLFTWQKQIKGKKEFEASYNLNYSLLKLRDAIKHVRNPAIWNDESYKAVQYFKKKYPERVVDENDLKKSADTYVYEMRWEEITKAYSKMESHLLAVEVLWGSEVLEKVKLLKRKITELNIGLQQYLVPELRTDNYKNLRDIIYDMSSEKGEDAFSKAVNELIGDIANYLKEKIK